MNKLAGLIGLAVALIASSPALANGYGQRNIPAPIPVPAPVPIPEGFTYYLRGDIGWGFAGDPSFSERGAQYGLVPLSYGALSGRGASTDDVFFGGIGAGAYLTPHLRGDITLDFRGAQEINAIATYIGCWSHCRDSPGDDRIAEHGRSRSTSTGICCRAAHSLPTSAQAVGFVYNDIDRSHLTTEAPGGVASLGLQRRYQLRPGSRVDGRRHHRAGPCLGLGCRLPRSLHGWRRGYDHPVKRRCQQGRHRLPVGAPGPRRPAREPLVICHPGGARGVRRDAYLPYRRRAFGTTRGRAARQELATPLARRSRRSQRAALSLGAPGGGVWVTRLVTPTRNAEWS